LFSTKNILLELSSSGELMSYLIKVLILLSALVVQVSFAQGAPTAFVYKEITIGEQAIESPRVVVVYSDASGVVEVRFQECDGCEFRTLFPAPDIRFSAGGESLPVEIVSEKYRNSPGTVFYDAATSKVNRIKYFQTRNGGEK